MTLQQPQYQSYLPPSPLDALRAPARRASVLLFVLGGLALLFGLCVTTAAFAAPLEQMVKQSGMKMPAYPGMTEAQTLRMVYATMGILVLIASVVATVLGLLVRSGRRGWIICAIVYAVVVGLFLLLEAAGSLLMVTQNPMAAVGAFLMIAVPILMIGLLLFWLSQAARNAGTLSQQQAALQTQMWQSQQQRAAYAPTGYGYAAPLPPPGAPPIDPRAVLPGSRPSAPPLPQPPGSLSL